MFGCEWQGFKHSINWHNKLLYFSRVIRSLEGGGPGLDGGFAMSSGARHLSIFLLSHPEHVLVTSWPQDGKSISSMASALLGREGCEGLKGAYQLKTICPLLRAFPRSAIQQFLLITHWTELCHVAIVTAGNLKMCVCFFKVKSKCIELSPGLSELSWRSFSKRRGEMILG